MWHKHLQKKATSLFRVDNSSFLYQKDESTHCKKKERILSVTVKHIFAECPYVIKDLPKVTDKVLWLCSFVPFNVPELPDCHSGNSEICNALAPARILHKRKRPKKGA